MIDFVICAMPALILESLPGAPAILKSAVEQTGFSAKALDLSLEFYINQCNSDVATYHRLGGVFRPSEQFEIEAEESCKQWIEDSIQRIQEVNPKIIGLSVFSAFQHRSTYLLARELKRRVPNTKIILGGMGLSINCSSLSNFNIPIKKIDLVKTYHQYMTELGFADYIILGSGLDELIAILSKEIGSNQNIDTKFNNTSVIFKTPVPNYDDYKISKYCWNNRKYLPVTGSKGCVRSCAFCDIPGQFGRFSFRTGDDIAKEMIFLKEKHGVSTFEFTDSLVNGSFKAFRQWLTIVAEYNDNRDPHDQIRWFGQYICRPQAHTPSDIYPLMARSGVIDLKIGVESGSDSVLEAMKKKVTAKDVLDELEQFEKNKISCTFLMFSGFYNETSEYFYETLKFLVDCQPYVASGTINTASFGQPLNIHSGTYLYDEADRLGLILDPYDESQWTSIHDPENDYVQRSKNRIISQLLAGALGYPFSRLGIGLDYQNLQKLKRRKQELEKLLDATTQLTTN
jgi:radical SAM superfamily enzyme YgiQ (UPF0313 family)